MDEKVRLAIHLPVDPPMSGTQRVLTRTKAFDPALPPTLSFHLVIQEAALVLHLRTLCPAASPVETGFSLRTRLGLAAPAPSHDESGRTFVCRGQEVRVREKVRVESQDPSLMAAMAKLSALEHGVRVCRRALEVVMGVEEEEEEE